MRQNATIGVLIPALNEEQAIGKVISAIPGWVDKIIVVDNGSRDQTAEIAQDYGVYVVHEPIRGYGRACQRGLQELQHIDVIVFLDGDYSDYPEQMDLLVDPIVDGDYDFVIGSRIKAGQKKGALTLQQRFGNWLACKLIWLIWRVSYTDLGPFRSIRRTALSQLHMQDQSYGWTVEMQIKAILTKLKIHEVMVDYRPRIGISKISGSIKASVLAGIKILSLIAKYALLKRTMPYTRQK
ncbi:MAG: glycosyltransferase family 2 protein [Pseudomonadota bacterium]